jgi:hypothetical protein
LGFLKMLALTLNDLEHGQILPLTQRSWPLPKQTPQI